VSIQYVIDTIRGVVRVDATGAVGPGETLRYFEQLAADASLPAGMPQLVDFTHVNVAPTAAESESVAQGFTRLRDRFQGVRCAVVVSDPLMYGAIRQFASMAARAEVEVRPFLESNEARRWLGVPDDL
jgi:hypothetical protein